MISDTEGEICQFMPEQAYIWSTENTKFFFFTCLNTYMVLMGIPTNYSWLRSSSHKHVEAIKQFMKNHCTSRVFTFRSDNASHNRNRYFQ